MTPKKYGFFWEGGLKILSVKNCDEICNVLLREVDSRENLQPSSLCSIYHRVFPLGMTSPDLFFMSPSFSQIHLIKSSVQKKTFESTVWIHTLLRSSGSQDLDHDLSPKIPTLL